MKREINNEEKLSTMPIGRLILSMSVPTVIAQLVNVLYNIVDRMYIGHIPDIGSIALTSLGICFPILTLIAAFSGLAGAGGAPLAAIELGKGNKKEAERILGNAFLMLITFSIILTIFFQIAKEPVLYAFGASNATIGFAKDYITIYLCGTVFVQLSLGLNMFITSQGKTQVAMVSILIGAVLNIILDPIFIYGFAMGVKGAALATVISQMCSAIWVLHFLLSSRASVRIRKCNLQPSFRTIKKISALGISPFIMQSTESLVTIVFNIGAQKYGGDLYVGSITIMQSIMQLFVVPVQGFNMGTQPIISYNYGAHNNDRVRKTFKYGLIVSLCVSCTATLLVLLFPQYFALIFANKDNSLELINIVKRYLPIFLGGIWMFGVQMACQSAFMGMGQAKISLFLALLRKIILLIPLACILPRFFGIEGLYYSEPISDIIAATITGTIFLTQFKRILNKIR